MVGSMEFGLTVKDTLLDELVGRRTRGKLLVETVLFSLAFGPHHPALPRHTSTPPRCLPSR